MLVGDEHRGQVLRLHACLGEAERGGPAGVELQSDSTAATSAPGPAVAGWATGTPVPVRVTVVPLTTSRMP